MYLLLRTLFNVIIYALVYTAYGLSWQYLLCFITVVGLMITCYAEGKDE